MTTPAPPANKIGTALTAPISDLDNFISSLSQDYSGVTALAITVGARIVVAVLIMVGGWIVGNWLSRHIAKSTHIDPTLRGFMKRFVKYVILTISTVTVIGLFGIPMASLLAVMGAAGLAIGLALQGTLANVASGVMILLLRPFEVGDYIDYNSGSGTVEVLSLGMFGTEVATLDNVFIYAPNSKIWGGNDIKNYSRNGLQRQEIKINIAAGGDADKAEAALRELLAREPGVIQDAGKEPSVFFDAVSAGALTLVLRFWIKSNDFGQLRSTVTKHVRAKLAAIGITLA